MVHSNIRAVNVYFIMNIKLQGVYQQRLIFDTFLPSFSRGLSDSYKSNGQAAISTEFAVGISSLAVASPSTLDLYQVCSTDRTVLLDILSAFSSELSLSLRRILSFSPRYQPLIPA